MDAMSTTGHYWLPPGHKFGLNIIIWCQSVVLSSPIRATLMGKHTTAESVNFHDEVYVDWCRNSVIHIVDVYISLFYFLTQVFISNNINIS